MTKTLPATKVRQNFFKLLNETDQPGSSITITVGGEPRVVMMPADDYEGWMETLEIMSDEKLYEDLKKGLKNWRKEKLYTQEEVKKMLKL